jgi:hypothetical protein
MKLANLLNELNPVSWAKNGIYEAAIPLFEGITTLSSLICLTTGMIGLLLWIFGYEKGKNYPFISIGAYFIINIIAGVIL